MALTPQKKKLLLLNGLGLSSSEIPVALDFQNQRYWLGSASTKVLTEVAGFTYSRPGYNLIPYSSDPSNGTAWGTGNATKTAGLPDRFGGNTAARITADGLSASHYGGAGFNSTVFTSGVTYNLALDFFAETQSLVQITGTGGVFGTAQYANFNLATGVLTASAGVVGTPQIENLGAGWYRASVSLLATASSAAATGLIAGAITSPTAGRLELNTLATSFLIARPQVEPGTVANAYQPTGATAITFAPITTAEGLVDDVATNLLTCWSANPTEAAGFVGNPVGMVKGGDAAGVLSVVDDAAALAAAGLSSICTSGKVYKLDNLLGTTQAIANLYEAIGAGKTGIVSAWVRAGSGSGTVTGGLTAEGSAFFTNAGYQRQQAVIVTAASRLMTVRANAGSVVYFILPGLYVRSAPITQDVVTLGASASGVVGQVEGVITFAANEPRLTSRGLLVEETRTEATLNNVWDGWEIGESIGNNVQGGSVANGVMFDLASGVTASVVGKGVDKGLPYVDVRVQGTPAASSHFQIRYIPAAAAPAAVAGEAWVNTCDLALVAGSLTNVSGVALRVDELNSSLATLTIKVGSDLKAALTSTLTRQALQTTLTDAACAKARGYVVFSGSGAAVDYTIRIAAPNCHKGTGVTSRILTGATAVTRPADLAWITGLGAYLAAPFTLSVWTDLPAIDGVVRGLGQVNDGSSNNRIDVRRGAANEAIFPTTVAGAQTVRTGAAGKTGARVLKMSVRQRGSAQAFAVDSQLFVDAAQASPTGLNRLDIGNRIPGLDHVNGYIPRIQIAGNTSDAQLKRFSAAGYAIPEPPTIIPVTDIALSAATVAENSTAGSVIGAFSSTPSGATFSLLDDAGGKVALSSSNLVVGLAGIDYETDPSFTISVRATLAGQTRDETFTITVTDVLEYRPIGLSYSPPGASAVYNPATDIPAGALRLSAYGSFAAAVTACRAAGKAMIVDTNATLGDTDIGQLNVKLYGEGSPILTYGGTALSSTTKLLMYAYDGDLVAKGIRFVGFGDCFGGVAGSVNAYAYHSTGAFGFRRVRPTGDGDGVGIEVNTTTYPKTLGGQGPSIDISDSEFIDCQRAVVCMSDTIYFNVRTDRTVLRGTFGVIDQLCTVVGDIYAYNTDYADCVGARAQPSNNCHGMHTAFKLGVDASPHWEARRVTIRVENCRGANCEDFNAPTNNTNSCVFWDARNTLAANITSTGCDVYIGYCDLSDMQGHWGNEDCNAIYGKCHGAVAENNKITRCGTGYSAVISNGTTVSGSNVLTGLTGVTTSTVRSGAEILGTGIPTTARVGVITGDTMTMVQSNGTTPVNATASATVSIEFRNSDGSEATGILFKDPIGGFAVSTAYSPKLWIRNNWLDNLPSNMVTATGPQFPIKVSDLGPSACEITGNYITNTAIPTVGGTFAMIRTNGPMGNTLIDGNVVIGGPITDSHFGYFNQLTNSSGTTVTISNNVAYRGGAVDYTAERVLIYRDGGSVTATNNKLAGSLATYPMAMNSLTGGATSGVLPVPDPPLGEAI